MNLTDNSLFIGNGSRTKIINLPQMQHIHHKQLTFGSKDCLLDQLQQLVDALILISQTANKRYDDNHI